jgi:NAD(P)-dependent dehydrogenase (short-subunit alcohol dehydrogenase family)
MERNPVALVVGAGDYIGAAISRRFAAGGYTVCMGRRNGEKLDPIVREIEDAGGCAHGYSLDAREETQVQRVFETIENDVGALDIVIFNVGGNVSFPIRDTTTRVFTKVWQMACLAGFYASVDRFSLRVRRPVCEAGTGMRPLLARNPGYEHLPNRWPVSWGRRTSTLPTS